jgi:ubiquinone/menaquinone biosynthesis C-methylase UbiE
MSGKGSKPRPYSVDQKTFDNNWDVIFKKKTDREKALEEMMRVSEEMGAYVNEPIINPLVK